MEEDESSVRVAVRIRPQTPRELIDMCQTCTYVIPDEPQVMLGKDKSFTYDHVFDTDDVQQVVYDRCVGNLVNSALEGYNATVFAYGQTGSGKTYTMGTGFDVEVDAGQVGIIPRAIHHLFDGFAALADKARESGELPPQFKVTAQFLELYNEELKDLFNSTYNKDKKYRIHEDAYGNIQVKDITYKQVTSAEEALQCLRIGALSRTTAATQMNTQSSRSHAIFTLQIKQQRFIGASTDSIGPSTSSSAADETETLTSKFHFVDLAGSERLKRTGATGERAREGISINCGLLALGNVISALSDKAAQHIPYRDSNLTRLLQDSLGGNSMTVMIACISPSDRDFMETLNTLKYADRAKKIKNKVHVNQDKSSKTIAQLKQKIAELNMELVEYKQGKRLIDSDGTAVVNDMFYENNLLQSELNNLKTRVKAMQDTIDLLTRKNTNLITERELKGWGSSVPQDNDEGAGGELCYEGPGEGTDESNVGSIVQKYLEEIEELRSKLIEANCTCDQLRKQYNRVTNRSVHMEAASNSGREPQALIEEAKRHLERDRVSLSHIDSVGNSENESDSGGEIDGEEQGGDEKEDDSEFKTKLFDLTNDIDMKQKLIDQLELSQRRMDTMRQQYEDKFSQLQIRIKNTQDERDQILHSYGGGGGNLNDTVKKIREEYSKKLADMQKELKKLQIAQKEHVRLIRSQSQQQNQLKGYKNELLDLKRAKIRLINNMKEESKKHKQSEIMRNREIAQLKKESRKNANVIKTMEAENRIKDKVLKRKQEEVTLLRRNQRKSQSCGNSGGGSPPYSERFAKQKWLKVEKAINNIALSKRGLIEQEVRMENFLEKREVLTKELEALERRRRYSLEKNQDVGQIDSYIEDIKENINYVQETISETQKTVIEIEESHTEGVDLESIVDNIGDLNEAKYLLQKLYNMTLSQSHAVAQKDAKLKETEANLEEIMQENQVKGQLLDHVLHNEFPYFSNDLTGSVSVNETYSSSNGSSRSPSPSVDSWATVKTNQRTSKIRRHQAQPDELLFGIKP